MHYYTTFSRISNKLRFFCTCLMVEPKPYADHIYFLHFLVTVARGTQARWLTVTTNPVKIFAFSLHYKTKVSFSKILDFRFDMNKMNALVMLLIFWKATYKVKGEGGNGGCAFRSKALFTEKEAKDDWIKETKEFPFYYFTYHGNVHGVR